MPLFYFAPKFTLSRLVISLWHYCNIFRSRYERFRPSEVIFSINCSENTNQIQNRMTSQVDSQTAQNHYYFEHKQILQANAAFAENHRIWRCADAKRISTNLLKKSLESQKNL